MTADFHPVAADLLHHGPVSPCGIVDPDIHAAIDSLLADTTHADLVFVDMGAGMTVIEVTADSICVLASMIGDGPIDHALKLDGDASVSIRANTNGGATETIFQKQPWRRSVPDVVRLTVVLCNVSSRHHSVTSCFASLVIRRTEC